MERAFDIYHHLAAARDPSVQILRCLLQKDRRRSHSEEGTATDQELPRQPLMNDYLGLLSTPEEPMDGWMTRP
jgi:hypothetical protein